MSIPRPFVLWLLLFIVPAAYAQPGSLSSLSKDLQVKSIWEWYQTTLAGNKDSATVISKLKEAEELYRRRREDLPMQQAWLIQRFYIAVQCQDMQRSVDIMLKAEEEAGAKGWTATQAECWCYIGEYYFVMNKFGLAFEYMQRARNRFEEEGLAHYPYVKRYAGGLAECYYRFGEFEQAVKYLKECMTVPRYWHKVVFFTSIENSIALCYQQLKEYDSATLYFHKSHATAAAINDSFYMALSYGNLGNTYHLQGKDSLALPLLQVDYEGSIKAKEWGSATNAAMVLSTIYIRQGKAATAEKYLDFARKYVYSINDAGVYRNWYENQYRIYQFKKDYARAAMYADSLLFYKDSLASIRDTKTLNQAKLKVETEKYFNKVSALESQRRQQVFVRNAILVALLLAGVIGLLWVNRQRLKRNKELELAALAREKAQQQLQFAQQELAGYTNKLREKNELIEQFRQELDKLQQNGIQKNKERTENITHLLNATILTEEDWRTFRDLFEKVYPGFFIRLREKIPDLSAADTRLIALTKLQLSPRDMAAMLGVSYDAIKKARQRLRKKINLPEEGTLDELAEMI